MAYASATSSDVTAFDHRAFNRGPNRRAVAPRGVSQRAVPQLAIPQRIVPQRTVAPRIVRDRAGIGRTVAGQVAIGLGATLAVAATGGCVTIAATWLVAVSLATNPTLQGNRPLAFGALDKSYREAAAATRTRASSVALGDTVPAPVTRVAELTPPTAAPRASVSVPKLPPKPILERAIRIPLPLPRPAFRPRPEATHDVARLSHRRAAPLEVADAAPLPFYGPQLPAKRDALRLPHGPAASLEIADAAPPPSYGPQLPGKAEVAPPPRGPAAPLEVAEAGPVAATPISLNVFQKDVSLPRARDNPIAVPDNHTALYDIDAHMVYLPNGEQLEAHSGLGGRLDDPRFVGDKMRGPTPPNVYNLTLRGELFHGVRAIRLNPVGDARMFGRDGLLAHTYMLGPSGQSFGCVSFKNYPEFLHAFLRGEIDRLVVVPHLAGKPAATARTRGGFFSRFAFNNWRLSE